VVSRVKKSRKFFGTRRWGAGNTKNARGAGDRGGVGRGGRKHKMTYRLVYERESIARKGFSPFQKKRLSEIDLDEISKRVRDSKEQKPVLELRGYKVLGDGIVEKPVVVKASGFTKNAEKKLTEAGGEAVKL